MVIPEEYGGSGNSFTDLGVVYEVMGYHACPSPHHSSAVLSSQAILEAGDESQKQNLLPGIASGQQIYAFAYTEPEYAWGPGSVQLQATRQDSGFTLNGTKLFVPDANIADQLLVVGRTASGSNPEDGLSLFSAQVEGDALLTAIEELPPAVPTHEPLDGVEAADGVAAVGVFNLDDLGPPVGHDGAGAGRRDPGRHLQNTHPIQNSCHGPPPAKARVRPSYPAPEESVNARGSPPEGLCCRIIGGDFAPA